MLASRRRVRIAGLLIFAKRLVLLDRAELSDADISNAAARAFRFRNSEHQAVWDNYSSSLAGFRSIL